MLVNRAENIPHLGKQDCIFYYLPHDCGPNQIKTRICISEMDEIGGKHFSLWKISAQLDDVGISDEMSQPISMAMLHHFFPTMFCCNNVLDVGRS